MARKSAPKKHPIKVGGGIFARVLQRAERLGQNPDEVAETLLAAALDRADADDERQRREARYRDASDQAKAKGLPTPLRRDFGLPG